MLNAIVVLVLLAVVAWAGWTLWNLADLYSAPDAPEFARVMKKAGAAILAAGAAVWLWLSDSIHSLTSGL